MQDESTQKNGPLSSLEAEKITFPPKPTGRTDRQTDGHTDGHMVGHTDRRA